MRTQNRSRAIGMFALTMLPALAAADDAKTLPGAACQPSRSQDAVLRGGVAPTSSSFFGQVNSLGGMFNTDELQSQIWICPIIRDSVTAPAGIRNAQIYAIDQNSATKISCMLCSRNAFGDQGKCTQLRGTGVTAPSSAAKEIPFSEGIEATPGNGYYFFWCSVPPREAIDFPLFSDFPTVSGGVSGIVSYIWTELGG
jgi:hypothetical protein